MSLHELFSCAEKLDGMIIFNDDGELQIIDDRNNTITIDNQNDTIADFLLAVHTLVEQIREM